MVERSLDSGPQSLLVGASLHLPAAQTFWGAVLEGPWLPSAPGCAALGQHLGLSGLRVLSCETGCLNGAVQGCSKAARTGSGTLQVTSNCELGLSLAGKWGEKKTLLGCHVAANCLLGTVHCCHSISSAEKWELITDAV